ncbi:MAG: nucleoside phosphorylase, partial [Bacilli bacterium]|nr:nucleoside phosphorylase [Bacilli bacterium]
PDKNSIIRPQNLVKKITISENCVITFFADELEKIIEKYPNKVLEYFKFDSFKLPIYEVNYNGNKIVLIQAMVGAPAAARQVEDLIVRGCNKFIVCGDCGVLDKDIGVGHIILPTAAIRDEGTSYHYIKPSKEIKMNKEVLKVLEKNLIKNNIQFIKAKTWTTDAFYRETKSKVIRRKSEGCLAVEMEASAYMAVAKFNNVKLGQILYASDNLDSKDWNRRKDQDKIISREFLLDFAIQCCLKL